MGKAQATATSYIVALVKAPGCPTSLLERVKQQGLMREVLPYYLGRVYNISNIVSKG